MAERKTNADESIKRHTNNLAEAAPTLPDGRTWEPGLLEICTTFDWFLYRLQGNYSLRYVILRPEAEESP